MYKFLDNKYKELKLPRLFLFLLSPFFSIPFVLHGIYNRNKSSVVLLVLIISILSFLYIPSITNDKAYYYYFYDTLNYSSFSSFLNYLTNENTDFILYIVIYLFKILNIPLHFLFFILTAVTLLLWYSVFFKLTKFYSFKQANMFFIFVLVILFSFAPDSLFSGIRYYLAVSFVFYGFCSAFLFGKSFLKSFIYIILGCLSHYSCLAFIPVFTILFFKPNNNKLYWSIFLISFVFILIPREFFLDKANIFELNDAYQEKASGYLGESDFVENSLSIGNFSNFLKYIFNTLWVYIAYIYLLLSKKKSIVKNSLLLVLALCNIFSSAPTVYSRFVILALGLFIMLLMTENLSGIKNKKFVYALFLILSLNFFGNIYAMKDRFLASFIDIHSISLVTTLLKDDIKFNDIQIE